MKKSREISSILTPKGKVAWRSPANIALVKYWGKKGHQIPANPSVSLTLNSSVTIMEMDYETKDRNEGVDLEFYFDGRQNLLFEDKIRRFLENLPVRYDWLKGMHLTINSRNTFPHSAGIASSASSMSALALCLLSVRQRAFGTDIDEKEFYREASDLARQASGSAGRSVYGGFAIWGDTPGVPESNDKYAIPFPGDIDPVFLDFKDAILLVSSATKSVSSRAGHGLMNDHPLAEARYRMAARNATDLVTAMHEGDTATFIRITEQEAMTLHGLMMSSGEPFLLLQPNSLVIMEKIREFRRATGYPVCFTIDAGPNIHLLYPDTIAAQLNDWINSDLRPYLENGKWIDDGMGSGPVTFNN